MGLVGMGGPEVGIYKRKQENTLSTKNAIKKRRKHALDQESDQEKTKKKTFFFILSCFLL